MEDRLRFFLLMVIAVFIACFFCLAKCTSDYRDTIDRLEENQKQLEEGCKVDSVNHITTAISVVTDSKKETEQAIGKQGEKALDRLKTSPTKIKYLTNTITETKFDTIVEVKTITKHDTIAQCFTYIDDYISFGGEVINGRVDFDLSMRDSLTIVAHRKKKKFLFIPYYSRKEIQTDIVNMNPYCKVIYAKDIKVE